MHKIVIVEDDVTVRNELHTFLCQNGYQVIAPERFDGLVLYFEQNPPDLILLNVQLGEFDGFEICKRLRGKHAYSRGPGTF